MTTNAGLTKGQALKNLEIFGKNTIISVKVSATGILLRQFTSPLIYLLILAAALSFFLSSPIDAMAIMAIIVINALLGFIQEYRSEKLIEKLSGLIKKTAKVRRDGLLETIPEEEIVPGDIVILKEGDLVPADGEIITEETLQVNESTISGESTPLSKNKGDKISSGTVIDQGYCEFRVTATGQNSQLGKIALLTSKTIKTSKYAQEISKLSQALMKVTLSILFVIFALNLFLKGFDLPNIITFLMFTIALSISVVPEALPVITTLTLSSGALKLAKKHVVVKRLSAVEDLGNIEVLCTDKTGTITKNQLTIKSIESHQKEKLLNLMNVCQTEDNPFDKVIRKEALTNIEKSDKLKQIAFLPFDPKLRRRWTLIEEGSQKLLVVFGSAEEVVKLSANVNKKTYLANFTKLESSGLKPLALGIKKVSKNFSFNNEFDDANLEFLGFFTFHDPPRETAAETIKIAKKLDVQIKIITGDSLEVARYTAQAVNLLDKSSKCYTGGELQNLTEEDFDLACRQGVVFARIVPELKYKIVQSLKKQYTVAYQGDGINDAPAIKAANVGIAVDGAVDVAREAADIVLLQRDLRVTIEGVKSGRKIFNNIDKYIKHTMVSNWGNFFAVAIVSLFTNFLPLLPVQILLTGLFSDIPLLAVATDNVDPSELRKPKKYNNFELISLPVVLGTVTAIFNLGFYFFLRNQLLDERRTAWFLLITVMDLVVIFSVRKVKWMTSGVFPNKILTAAILTWIVAALALPFTPLAPIFHLQKVGFKIELLIVLLTVIYLFTLDISKVGYYKFIAKLNVIRPKMTL